MFWKGHLAWWSQSPAGKPHRPSQQEPRTLRIKFLHTQMSSAHRRSASSSLSRPGHAMRTDARLWPVPPNYYLQGCLVMAALSWLYGAGWKDVWCRIEWLHIPFKPLGWVLAGQPGVRAPSIPRASHGEEASTLALPANFGNPIQLS